MSEKTNLLLEVSNEEAADSGSDELTGKTTQSGLAPVGQCDIKALIDQIYHWRMEDKEESRHQREEYQKQQEEKRENFAVLLQAMQASLHEGQKQQENLQGEIQQQAKSIQLHVRSIQQQQERLRGVVQKEVKSVKHSVQKMKESFLHEVSDIEERVKNTELQVRQEIETTKQQLSAEMMRKIAELGKEPQVKKSMEPASAFTLPGSFSPRTRVLQKPNTFEGKTCWEDYHAQFEIIAQINDWDEAQKASFLAASLKVPAMTVLGNMSPDHRQDYQALVAALSGRFGMLQQAEVARNRLKNRTLKKEESLREMAEDIETLVRLAYSEAPPVLQDTLGRDHFIDALPNEEMRLQLRQERPKSLWAALDLALELESFQLNMKQHNRGHSDGAMMWYAPNDDLSSNILQQAPKNLKQCGPITIDGEKILQELLQELKALGSVFHMKEHPPQRPNGCWIGGQRGHIAKMCYAKKKDRDHSSEGEMRNYRTRRNAARSYQSRKQEENGKVQKEEIKKSDQGDGKESDR